MADARSAVDALELDLRGLERAGGDKGELNSLRGVRRKLDARLSKLDEGAARRPEGRRRQPQLACGE